MQNSGTVTQAGMKQGQVPMAGSLHGGHGHPPACTTATPQPGSIHTSWQVIRGLCREVWKLHVKVHILFLFQGKMGLLSFCLCISKQKALSSDKDCSF